MNYDGQLGKSGDLIDESFSHKSFVYIIYLFTSFICLHHLFVIGLLTSFIFSHK
jgi:hypothetical protein